MLTALLGSIPDGIRKPIIDQLNLSHGLKVLLIKFEGDEDPDK